MEAITHAPATATATFPPFPDLNSAVDGTFGRADAGDGFVPSGSNCTVISSATPVGTADLPAAVKEGSPVAQSLSPLSKPAVQTSESEDTKMDVVMTAEQVEQQNVQQPHVEGAHRSQNEEGAHLSPNEEGTNQPQNDRVNQQAHTDQVQPLMTTAQPFRPATKETMDTPPISEDYFKIDGVDDLPAVSLADVPAADVPADIPLPDAPAIVDSMEQPEQEVAVVLESKKAEEHQAEEPDPMEAFAKAAFPEIVLESKEAEKPEAEEPDPMQAFAKLAFPDGDFYVHTYAVELGRDINAHKHERKIGKQRKRRERNERKEMAERRRRQMEMEDDADALSPRDARDLGFLQDIPAPPMSVSNVSEVGGIMGIDMYSSDDASRTSRRPRKRSFRDSNSDHSLDPTTLHANPMDLVWHNEENVTPPRGLPEGLPDHAYQCPLIPIHPQAGASFKGISRRHVRIEYNLEHAYWEMFVTGRNTVYHDNQRIETGESARLHHGSEIIIQTITVIFKLPDNARNDDDDVIQELSDSSSALSEISDQEMLSSGDEPLRTKPRPSPPRKKVIKLKLGKPKDKSKADKINPDSSKDKSIKDKSDRPEKSSKSLKQASKALKMETPDKADKTPSKDRPDVAAKSKKLEKTEKFEPEETPRPTSSKEPSQSAVITPSTPVGPLPPPQLPIDVKQTIEGDDAAMIAALQAAEPVTSEASPAIPAELPPGSVLLGVAPEDIPAKRKGPGRPPKNGVMSKRDEAIIKRLTKDLQKQGKIVPPLNDLLAMARAEGSTKKDKEDGDGKPILEGSTTPGPSMAIDPNIMQSVESGSGTTPQIASQATPDKDSKPKRIVRTPSPQKPESEYTEEELKKPTQTYVVLIHESLSKSSTGIMDLQQIYDAMQKMYPYFKYRAGTSGWQSSVRHNLISSDAFQEAGKIGKGRLWKINPDVSIDKEKKRKAPTPPPQNAPQYPYYPNQQYPYGAPPNGNQAYPYARPSPYGTPYGPPAGPSGTRPPVPAPQQKPGTYYSPYASNPAGGAHASPYGPPSRAPYAPYPPQNQAQTGAPAQQSTPNSYGTPQGQPQQPGQASQAGQAGPATQQGQSHPQSNGQHVPQPPYQPQQNGQPQPSQDGQALPSRPLQQNAQDPQGASQLKVQPPQGALQQNVQPPQGFPQQNGVSQGRPPQQAGHPVQGPPQQNNQPPQGPPQQNAQRPQGPPQQSSQPLRGPPQQHGQPPQGPPQQPQSSQAPRPYAPSPSQASSSTTAPQPGGIDIAKAMTEIMSFQGSYLSRIAPGPETENARAMFTRAMTAAISGPIPNAPKASPAEVALTESIASIYARSRLETTPSAAPLQAGPGSAQSTMYRQTSVQSGSAPAANTAGRTPATTQHSMNTTPAPPQGNIPARYLPPQYNPRANTTATPPPPQQQGQRPLQQPHTQPQQSRPGSSSDVYVANPPRAGGTSQSPAPGAPVRGNAAGSPQPHTPYGSTPQAARPIQNGRPQAPAPSQTRPHNATYAPGGAATNGSAPLAQSLQPQAQGATRATPTPGSAPNTQQLSRPVFTPPVSQGQQANMIPPRPTFAPSPGAAGSGTISSPAPATPSAPSNANGSVPGSVQAAVTPGAAQSSAGPAQGAGPSQQPPPPQQQQGVSGSSVKRPIEIDEEDQGSEVKKVKT